MAAGDRARTVTSFTDPGVRAAALLSADLGAARRLVRDALGALGADTEAAARLRGTLLAFVTEKGSYVATAERTHLHKNTVKYRVDRALEERGRPLGEDRLDLELALIACEWLGDAVLAPETA
ncbi:helix-turn-helix domain-containing protein [Streptomyces sp. NPDC008163]|uniref:helix-turn-helix domain-containing protein n=1 Tax=Streptomyces sp. NPDC008163 TaxID=3364818 RepID=UPI0036E8F4B9